MLKLRRESTIETFASWPPAKLDEFCGTPLCADIASGARLNDFRNGSIADLSGAVDLVSSVPRADVHTCDRGLGLEKIFRRFRRIGLFVCAPARKCA
jgi:hypothetical protein